MHKKLCNKFIKMTIDKLSWKKLKIVIFSNMKKELVILPIECSFMDICLIN